MECHCYDTRCSAQAYTAADDHLGDCDLCLMYPQFLTECPGTGYDLSNFKNVKEQRLERRLEKAITQVATSRQVKVAMWSLVVTALVGLAEPALTIIQLFS